MLQPDADDADVTGTFRLPTDREFDAVPLQITHVQRVIVTDFFLDDVSSNNDPGESIPEYSFRFTPKAAYGNRPLCFFGRAMLDGDRQTILKTRSPDSDQDELDDTQMNMGGDDDSESEGDIDDQFAPSLQNQKSRYGSISFKVELASLIAEYRKRLPHDGDNDRVGLYELGSQIFQQEHAHAVLVCQVGDQRAKDLRFLGYADVGGSGSTAVQSKPEFLYEPLSVATVDSQPAFTWNVTAARSIGQWEAIEFAFLGPAANLAEPAMLNRFHIPSQDFEVALIERCKPNVPKAEYGGTTVSLAQGGYEILTKVFKKCMDRDATAVELWIPQKFKPLWDACWEHALQRVHDLISKKLGTRFATADGIERHLSLRDFNFPGSELRDEFDAPVEAIAPILKYHLERHLIHWWQ